MSKSLQILVQKIYTKSLGIAIQGLPDHFSSLNWNPVIDIKANPRYINLESNKFEVVLTLQLAGKLNDTPVFESQIDQAGTFTIENATDDQIEFILYGHCSNHLFPYAGVNLNLLLSQSGLPPVYLAPLNFVGLYKDHQAKQKDEKILVQ